LDHFNVPRPDLLYELSQTSGVKLLLRLPSFYTNLGLKSISMRSMLLTFVLLLNAAWLFSQDDVFSNKTNQALEKVIRDYPNRFHNIRGEMISQHENAAEYKSVVMVPGSSSCTISKFSVSSNEVYRWSCTALNTRDFATARGKFKEIYEQIENTIIKIDGQKPFILSGQYRTPTDLRNINTISFDLLPAVGDMKSLKIELSLEKDLALWKVKLNAYDGDHKSETATAAIQ
jgi:hypothetical protein